MKSRLCVLALIKFIPAPHCILILWSVSENGNGVTFNGDGSTGQSPGLPLSLSTDPSSSSGTAASTDNSSLTLLQPANNNAASAVSAYTPPTLLPGFSPHYTTGKKFPRKYCHFSKH